KGKKDSFYVNTEHSLHSANEASISISNHGTSAPKWYCDYFVLSGGDIPHFKECRVDCWINPGALPVDRPLKDGKKIAVIKSVVNRKKGSSKASSGRSKQRNNKKGSPKASSGQSKQRNNKKGSPKASSGRSKQRKKKSTAKK